MSGRYVVVFNPVEQERLCAVTVLVNTVKVRVLTETGQTLPVQLSGQWSSASQMSAEVFEVSEATDGAAVDGGGSEPPGTKSMATSSDFRCTEPFLAPTGSR